MFGVAVSPSRGGVLDLSAVAFPRFSRTRAASSPAHTGFITTTSSTGTPLRRLSPAFRRRTQRCSLNSAACRNADSDGHTRSCLPLATDAAGNTTVQRGVHPTSPADPHSRTRLAYPLKEKVAIVPFVKTFSVPRPAATGSTASNYRMSGSRAPRLYMTNAAGQRAVAVNPLHQHERPGLRTLSGGQFSFQITGYLAIQTGAAPDVIVDADRSVRQIYAVLRTPSAGAGVTLQLNLNGAPYTTLQFDPGQQRLPHWSMASVCLRCARATC